MSILKQNTERISFATAKATPEYPDFLEIQLKSFHNFFQFETTPESRKDEGLFKVFSENFPISDARNQFVLEFLDYFIDPPRYSIEECIQRGLTYSVPLKAKLKLYCLSLQLQHQSRLRSETKNSDPQRAQGLRA